ncbi:TPA: hypothetical protein ACH3X3_15260 [Trebouxia sp. C0006]
MASARYFCSSSCGHDKCQVLLLFFLCPWRLPGIRALLLSWWTLPGAFFVLLVLLKTARYIYSSSQLVRYICSSSCAPGNCQVLLLFFLCSWRLPGASALLLPLHLLPPLLLIF